MTVTLESLRGRVNDTDAHEMVAAMRYPEIIGEGARAFIDGAADMFGAHHSAPDAGTTEITPETVWEVKLVAAPSAWDMSRRAEVMDVMGIRRQLLFPTVGLFAMVRAHGGAFNLASAAESTPQQMDDALAAFGAYNEWAVDVTEKYGDRLRPAGFLASSQPEITPEILVKETEKLIRRGLRAIYIHTGMPPAGVGPADRALDAWYATMAEANVPLVFHPPSGTGYRKSPVWASYPFDMGGTQAEENFIHHMTLGGVFERHPTLRVGVIELRAATWIGALAERMDLAVEHPSNVSAPPSGLSMRPSEYLARNVRVSVLHYEPVEKLMQRYPVLRDICCYSSDYPHTEGGPYSMQAFYDRLKPLGDDILEKFFVTNGELLLS